MCPPNYFDVLAENSEQNPWMSVLRRPGPIRATEQWNEFHNFYQRCGVEVHCLRPAKNLFDQVFTANVACVIGNRALMGNLRPEWRKQEVNHVARWLVTHRYDVSFLPEDICFEGQGDVTFLPKRGTAFFSYGIRNDAVARFHLTGFCQPDYLVYPLKLVNPYLYHGDMCIRYSPARDALMWIPDAFDQESQAFIRSISFAHTFEVPRMYWWQHTKYGTNFPINGVSVGNIESFPWDETTSPFPPEIRNWVEKTGGEVWVHNADQFGLSGAGHRCMTLILEL